MPEKNSLLQRALVRLCPDPEDQTGRPHWERLLLGQNPDLDWLKQQLRSFLAGPPDALNCFVAAVLFLRYHYTEGEAFESQERLGGSRPVSAKDDPRFHLELFRTMLDFVKHGLPHRGDNPMREQALIYSALVAAGKFVGGEQKNSWEDSPGNPVIYEEMQLRGMRFATLEFEALGTARPQLVADAYHPTLHKLRLVIPNAKPDGTVKVRIDAHRQLTLQAGTEIIYFTDVADRFRAKKTQKFMVTVTPVATRRALSGVQDRATAIFPTCPFVG